MSVVCGTKVEDDRHKVLDGDNLLMKMVMACARARARAASSATQCVPMSARRSLSDGAMERGKRKGNIGMSQLAGTQRRRGCGGWGRV